MSDLHEIQELLAAFQEGYTHRDPARLDDFMNLFTPEAYAIGTNGIRPGQGEWFTDLAGVRALIQGDWESWGDFQLQSDSVSIHVNGDTAWLSALATVTQTIDASAYENHLNAIRALLDDPAKSAQFKLDDILRSTSNTLYELHQGETFIWPVRLTAVAVRREPGWRFAQLHFSFPTTRFPDVRLPSP